MFISDARKNAIIFIEIFLFAFHSSYICSKFIQFRDVTNSFQIGYLKFYIPKTILPHLNSHIFTTATKTVNEYWLYFLLRRFRTNSLTLILYCSFVQIFDAYFLMRPSNCSQLHFIAFVTKCWVLLRELNN